MPNVLYIDCVGGVAGDMLLGALIDAGADADAVRAALPVDGVALELTRVERGGVSATKADIRCDEQHAHRTWPMVRTIIDSAEMTPRARKRAHRAFELLAHAEGRMHDVPPEEVTFHEVGALDAIADICGVCTALELLEVDDVVCSALPLGPGVTNSAHGVLPLPAPATLDLLRGAAVRGIQEPGETVTPTGAALVAALASSYGCLPSMTLTWIGTGAGTRDSAHVPNVTRVLIGPRAAVQTGAGPLLLETNLDDLLPELVPDAIEACFAAGAKDVWTSPVTMKFGRPALVLSALYILWAYQRMMTGPVAAGNDTLRDLVPRELVVIAPLIALLLVLGVYPKPALDVINPSVGHTLTTIGVQDPAPKVADADGKFGGPAK